MVTGGGGPGGALALGVAAALERRGATVVRPHREREREREREKERERGSERASERESERTRQTEREIER